MELRKLLTLDEVSQLTRVPKNTLRYWRTLSPPQGPNMFKLGRRLVCDEEECLAWIQRQREDGGQVPPLV